MKIFTDGACSKNGYKGSKAGMGVYCQDPTIEISISVSHFKENNPEFNQVADTNNTGELLAIYIALQQSPESSMCIYTDSMYAIKCLTIWYKTWSKCGWVNSKKLPVKNKFIIQKILQSMEKRQVFFLHTPSHKKVPADITSDAWFIWNGNDIADKLATKSIL